MYEIEVASKRAFYRDHQVVHLAAVVIDDWEGTGGAKNRFVGAPQASVQQSVDLAAAGVRLDVGSDAEQQLPSVQWQRCEPADGSLTLTVCLSCVLDDPLRRAPIVVELVQEQAAAVGRGGLEDLLYIGGELFLVEKDEEEGE